MSNLINPAGRVAVVGPGAVSPFGTGETTFQIRTGQFDQALPELRRLMNRPHATREEIDRNIGIRVIRGKDTENGFDPQRFVTWVERGGQRFAKSAPRDASHAGVIPSGWDLREETGLTDKVSERYGRAHLMLERALAEAVVNMGVPWEAINQRIPRAQRGVAAANGLAPGQAIEEGMSEALLGRSTPGYRLETYLGDYMKFILGKRIGARYADTVQGACNTGIHNLGFLLDRFIKKQILFGALATTESCITSSALTGFRAKGALSSNRDVAKLLDHPGMVSRPGLKDRARFTMGEGGGVLLLMDMAIAQELGVQIYAEILAAETMAGDKIMIDPAAPTDGPEIVLEEVIRRTAELEGISEQEVVARFLAVISHGTSTGAGDLASATAYGNILQRYQRDPNDPLYVIYSKGGPRLEGIPSARQVSGIGTGHLLGGASSLSLVEGVQILSSGLIPPSVASLGQMDPKIAGAFAVAFPTMPLRFRVARGQRVYLNVDSQAFNDGNGSAVLGNYDPSLFEGGEESEERRRQSHIWMLQQIAAIQSGAVKPAKYLPTTVS